MKKLFVIICCTLIAFVLCGCRKNAAESKAELPNESVVDADSEESSDAVPEELPEENKGEFPDGGFIDGGRMKHSDADPEKTPLIHEAISLYYSRDYAECLEKMLLALEEGEFDPIAYFYIGNIYHLGYGVEEDDDLGIEYYSKGEEYKQPFCTYNLGNIYADRGDEEKAFEQYEKAIEFGEPMAYCRFIARDLFMDPASAESYLAKVVKSNDPQAMNHAGTILLDSRRNDYYKKAFAIFTKIADMGYTDGIHNLGVCYEIGAGVERNTQKAFEYYLKAAESYEFADYYIYVGICYENGVGVEKNSDKAIEYYELSTKDGNGEGWYRIGRLYELGTLVEKDPDKALEYYALGYQAKIPSSSALERYNRLTEISAEKENTEEKLERAMDIFDAGDCGKALEILKPEAEKGNATAIHYVGWCSIYGNPEYIDYDYAKQCFDTALEKGETKAYIGLGTLYRFGWGVEQDFDKAEEYFTLAREANFEPATYDLANMYYLEMERYEDAVALFEELINSGCKKDYVFDAISKVSYHYYFNLGDIDTALKYYLIGADLGDGNCMNNAGSLYEEKGDYEKAKAYYEQAIAAGAPEGYLSLGYLYETGNGVEQDLEKALEYYKKSMDGGYDAAASYYDALAETVGSSD